MRNGLTDVKERKGFMLYEFVDEVTSTIGGWMQSTLNVLVVPTALLIAVGIPLYVLTYTIGWLIA